MNLEGFRFADPVWLYGILALPLLMALFILASRSKRATLVLGNPGLVERSPGFFSAQLTPWILRFLVLALCLGAAARPQAGQKKVEEKRTVTDLYVAFDVSTSMLTNDLKPNRVTAAKKILSEFLDKVQDARVGLTVFARISFTQCPLTTDLDVVKRLLANVEVFSVKLDGTAIGDALVSCLSRLESGGAKAQDQPAAAPSLVSRLIPSPAEKADQPGNHQAIILLTDGGNNAGQVDPLTAAKIAASRGVKVYGIGVGGTTRVPAVYMFPNGKTTYGIDPRTGQIAMSDPVDMGLLKEIARITGGVAYNASNNSALQAILSEIAKLEKRDVAVVNHWEYQELAPWFLIAASVLLGLDVLLGMTVLRTLP